jgi:hypothetical protein
MQNSIAWHQRNSVRTRGNSFFETRYCSLTVSSIYFAVADHASTVEKEPAVICSARSFGERFAS